jgi:hypothetical protein
MDDVIFPDATSGWLFVAGTPGNAVYKLWVTGLTIGTPIIALGSFNEVATVNPVTGVVETPLLNVASPHGMDFIAAPEPSTWAMMIFGFAGLGFAASRRRQDTGRRRKRLRMALNKTGRRVSAPAAVLWLRTGI